MEIKTSIKSISFGSFTEWLFELKIIWLDEIGMEMRNGHPARLPGPRRRGWGQVEEGGRGEGLAAVVHGLACPLPEAVKMEAFPYFNKAWSGLLLSLLLR